MHSSCDDVRWCLCDEKKWGEWHRYWDIGLGYYWPSDYMSAGSFASGLWWTMGDWNCGKNTVWMGQGWLLHICWHLFSPFLFFLMGFPPHALSQDLSLYSQLRILLSPISAKFSLLPLFSTSLHFYCFVITITLISRILEYSIWKKNSSISHLPFITSLFFCLSLQQNFSNELNIPIVFSSSFSIQSSYIPLGCESPTLTKTSFQGQQWFLRCQNQRTGLYSKFTWTLNSIQYSWLLISRATLLLWIP